MIVVIFIKEVVLVICDDGFFCFDKVTNRLCFPIAEGDGPVQNEDAIAFPEEVAVRDLIIADDVVLITAVLEQLEPGDAVFPC